MLYLVKMNHLAVVTPPYIYHCCSTRKTIWEKKFTGEEKLSSAVNMKCSGRRNVGRYREIKGSYKYVTLDISLKFDSLEKMKITSSGSKEKLERLGKGLIISLGIKAKVRRHKYKNQRMPLEMSVRRLFQRLLGSLINCLTEVMRRRGPNMSLITVTFT